MATPNPIDAGEHRVGKIFSPDYDFEIPEYQRPYSWESEQTLQLLSDLEDSLEDDGEEPYFLGSVVLVKMKDKPKAQVIDGQQRLTTLTILIAVLRELAEQDKLSAELSNFILEEGSIVSGASAKPRLALRRRDAKFFEQYIQEPGRLDDLETVNPEFLLTDAQRAIRSNALLLRKELQDWSDEKRTLLAQALGVRTFLVVVSTPNLESAHRIFSVMNSRGLDLSATDIFKADVVGALPENERAEAANQWEDVEEKLGRDNFADLFQHIRTIQSKNRLRREILHEFKDQVLDTYLPDRSMEFIEKVLLPYSWAFAEITDHSYKGGPKSGEVNFWLRRLGSLDNRDWYPPALWALKHRHKDPVFLAAFLKKLERLAASMSIRRIYQTPRVQRFAELLKELDNRDLGLDSPAFELSETEITDTIDQLNGDLYLVKPIRKYVLLRLDEILAKQSGVDYHHDVITVEHVLPQNPKEDSVWTRNFSQLERERWTHRLANLVLLNRSKNSQARNYDFDVKKFKYFTSRDGVVSFALTTQVIEQTEWTPNVLENRQRYLVGLLMKDWDFGHSLGII